MDKQLWYLMTVQTWLAGSTSAPKGLLQLPEKKQALLIASALNELLQLTPLEEKTQFRSSMGMSGTTHLLRSKIEYLIRREQSNGPRPQAGKRPRSGIGTNFTGYPEDRE